MRSKLLVYVSLLVLGILVGYLEITLNKPIYRSVDSLSNRLTEVLSKNRKVDSSKTGTSDRYAIFSCSIHSTNDAYIFYAPILVAAWRRVGYETIIVFTGDFTKENVLTAHLNLSRLYLKQLAAQVFDFQCPEAYATKASQIVRVFSGFLPNSIVQDNDDIISSDSDLMPLGEDLYRPKANTDGFIYNAHCCGTFQRRQKTYRMFPMGHIALKKKIWRSMVLESEQNAELVKKNVWFQENSTLNFDLISAFSRHEFGETFDRTMTKGDASWYMDQVLCSMFITDFRVKNSSFRIDERSRGNRLDRSIGISGWDRSSFSRYGDAHLIHHQLLEQSTWKVFRKLLNSIFNREVVSMFDEYFQQYVVLRKSATKN